MQRGQQRHPWRRKIAVVVQSMHMDQVDSLPLQHLSDGRPRVRSCCSILICLVDQLRRGCRLIGMQLASSLRSPRTPRPASGAPLSTNTSVERRQAPAPIRQPRLGPPAPADSRRLGLLGDASSAPPEPTSAIARRSSPTPNSRSSAGQDAERLARNRSPAPAGTARPTRRTRVNTSACVWKQSYIACFNWASSGCSRTSVSAGPRQEALRLHLAIRPGVIGGELDDRQPKPPGRQMAGECGRIVVGMTAFIGVG